MTEAYVILRKYAETCKTLGYSGNSKRLNNKKNQKAKEILLKTAQAFSNMVDMMTLVRNCVKEMDLM